MYSLTGHLIIPEIFVFSKRTWDTLSKADQELVRKLSREAQLEQRQLWDEYVGEAETKLKAAGVQFVQADKPAFYKATQPIRDKYGVEVRRAAEAHRRHEVTQPTRRHAAAGPRAFFCPERAMDAKQRYQQAMEWLYIACIVISGAALVVITLIIPLGVFMRYVMNSPLSGRSRRR